MIELSYSSSVVGSPPQGVAFLLAQLGAHAAMRFDERVGEVGFFRPQPGILGLLSRSSGISQQELAETLGILPSRVVAFVDELEEAGLVTRVRDAVDRRRNTLVLTSAGRAAWQKVATVARAHEAEISSALSDKERDVLAGLLTRIADDKGLTPGVHPGYRTVRPPATRR